jgi:hypothetical protein
MTNTSLGAVIVAFGTLHTPCRVKWGTAGTESPKQKARLAPRFSFSLLK